MKGNYFSIAIAAFFLASLLACQPVAYHKEQIRNDAGDRVTVGVVQKEIRVGMSSSEVATVLGSPNIVTTDDQRREVWIYDKLSTETAHSTSSGGVSALFLGIGSSAGGGIGGSGSQSTGATSTSQRTLTVIIKFDNNSKVRDFAYHTSRF